MEEKHVFELSAGEKAFWLSNGEKIETIRELYEKLDGMHDDTFNYHVNEQRNDFERWIRDVYEDHGFADNISVMSNRSDFKSAVGAFIANAIHKNYKKKNGFLPKINNAVSNGLSSMVKGIKNIHSKKKVKKSSHNSRTKKKITLKLPDFSKFLGKLTGKKEKKFSFTLFNGVLDFVLGFTVGALSTLLMIKII